MQIIFYIVCGVFVLLAAGLVFTYLRGRSPGHLLMAAAYGASAGAAIALDESWPLLAGFGAAWAVRFLGLDPKPKS